MPAVNFLSVPTVLRSSEWEIPPPLKPTASTKEVLEAAMEDQVVTEERVTMEELAVITALTNKSGEYLIVELKRDMELRMNM